MLVCLGVALSSGDGVRGLCGAVLLRAEKKNASKAETHIYRCPTSSSAFVKMEVISPDKVSKQFP